MKLYKEFENTLYIVNYLYFKSFEDMFSYVKTTCRDIGLNAEIEFQGVHPIDNSNRVVFSITFENKNDITLWKLSNL